MTDTRLPCGHGWSRPERGDCPYCDNEKLRAKIERLRVELGAFGNALATRGNELTEARAEIARLRARFCPACGEHRGTFDPHCYVCGASFTQTDGGQKTSEAHLVLCIRPYCRHERARHICVETPGVEPCDEDGCPCADFLAPAIPPRAASGGEAPERVTLKWMNGQLYIPQFGMTEGTTPIDYVRADIANDLLAALRALVTSLPKCSKCPKPATRAWVRGEARYCDDHKAMVYEVDRHEGEAPEYPRAAPLRAAIAIIAKLEARKDPT